MIAALLPSLLMLWRYTSGTGLTVFTELVDLTVVTVAIPYLFSACAQLTYLLSGRRRVQGWLLARDLTITAAATLFSLWVTFAAGYSGRVPGDGGRARWDHPLRLPKCPPRVPQPRSRRQQRRRAAAPDRRPWPGGRDMSFNVQSEVGSSARSSCTVPGWSCPG